MLLMAKSPVVAFLTKNPTKNFPNFIRSMASKSARLNLAGIYPPITTPFNQDESIAFDKLQSNMEKWLKCGFRGFVVMGSNGEAPYLSRQEKLSLVEAVKSACKGTDHLVIAGSGAESTSETLDLSRAMAQAGADAALVITPSFYKSAMNSDALKAHYTKVADDCPIPVILYNVPANTGVELTADLAIELAQHPNCIGIKDSGGDIAKITRMVAETRDLDFQVLCGSAGFLLPGLQVGAVGGFCASANCLGAELVQLQREHDKNGCSKKALELQARLVAPNAAVTRGFGVPGLKYALDRMGYYGGPLRLPLQPLNEAQKTAVDKIFGKNGFEYKN